MVLDTYSSKVIEMRAVDDPVLNATTADRRRPGRREDTSPHLIPLLRGGTEDAQPEVEPDMDLAPEALVVDAPGEEYWELAPAYGITVGVVLGALFWASILWLVGLVH